MVNIVVVISSEETYIISSIITSSHKDYKYQKVAPNTHDAKIIF